MRWSRLSILAFVALAVVAAGCDVDPFCLHCTDEDAGPSDAGADAGGDAGLRDAGPGDAGPADSGPDGCVPGATELCNERDDDCDGEVDEGIDTDTSLEHCGGCGLACAPPHAFGECVGGACGIATCDVGWYDIDGDPDTGCEYRCLPTEADDTLCDLRDNDCDGEIDEDVPFDTDPSNCGSCGRICSFAHATASCESGDCVLSACDAGFHDLDGLPGNGCEYACTPADPPTETCNARDDDCDGDVDEGDPGGGGSCGTDQGACTAGTLECVGGSVVCVGATGPTTEECNGVDDDCDGSTDEGNPAGGGSCGTDEGTCVPGTWQCTGGSLVCEDAVGPGTETCDGLDNDCDGTVDDGDPGGGGSCGTDEGECVAGTEHCSGGVIQCVGATGPSLDLCDSVDNDCDGTADEDFDLDTDVRNCGACDRPCSFPNGIAGCSGGSCVLVACVTGYYDLDGMDSTGCEYECDFAGSEVCNGRDDDCDGTPDEDLTPPSNFCNPNGVCMGTTAACSGASGWTCDYPMTYEESETTCDGLDNDCDGSVDEPFPTVGTSCNNGELGLCRRTGAFVCNGAGDGVVCDAPASGGGATETCNGRDDDCDGLLDEDSPAEWVQFSGSFGTRWIFAYEASRPDSDSASEGTMSHRACSLPDRLPWTNVTHAQAQTACASVGGRLCTEAEWERACETASSCTWSYASSCTSYSSGTCNGNDYDYDSGAAGDQDGVLPTGSLGMCYASWSGGGVYDMSGNVEEWTEQRSAGVNPLRGGSNNDTPGGIRCDFDFVVAGNSYALPTVGFRCCRDSAP